MVLVNNLGETLGFFSSYKRSKFIHINMLLDDPVKKFVCAHELGHAILHPKLNTPFLKAHTLFSTNRLEREANRFAVELLLPDEVLSEYRTIYDAVAANGLPAEVAELKKPDGNWIKRFWQDERTYFII